MLEVIFCHGAHSISEQIKDRLQHIFVLFGDNLSLRKAALDAACLLELASPAVPALFVPLAATANVGKNISWLAASASRHGNSPPAPFH